MRETDWTKVLGWPGYRVYRHEINEEAKTLKLWVRRKRGNRKLVCSGCGRKLSEVYDTYERENYLAGMIPMHSRFGTRIPMRASDTSDTRCRQYKKGGGKKKMKTKSYEIFCAVLALAFAMPAVAGTKSKGFDVPADVLYESAVRTAAQNYKLTTSDSAHQRFAFRTGASATSWGLEVQAAVQAVSASSSKLVVDIQNSDSRQVFSWGAGGRMADKFFKDVEATLAGWRPVDYSFSLVKPTETSSLVFEDEHLKIAFTVSRKAIGFSLTNKTDSPVKIDWNQLSYVDVDGKSHKVFHKGVAYKDREGSFPPSIVPPTATFEDLVLPSDYSQWSDVGGGFYTFDLLPQAANAGSYVGKIFSVFMPVEVNSAVKNYLFSFKITQAEVKEQKKS
ncbi:MAG TPA: hypothetical protein VEV41_12770 [Terriglobales bacterium]|nr:hypothetical protein [Terriglobales bacterium]